MRRFCTLMKQKYRGRITSVKKAKTTPAAAQGPAIDEVDRRGRPSDTILRPIRAACSCRRSSIMPIPSHSVPVAVDVGNGVSREWCEVE